tara:strand:+ start:1957 stop:2445 length:489 start_codon:yes stop_codon:yes gene_type:complete
MRVVQNYLNQDYFNQLTKAFVEPDPTFPVYRQQRVAYTKGKIRKKHFYFTHIFFNNEITSKYYDLLKPLVWDILKVKALIRIKLNVYPRTDTLLHHGSHVDYDFKHKGLLLSLNTCDGGTRIGKKFIPSVANQALFFNAGVTHNSTTCTDQQTRININFNYF